MFILEHINIPYFYIEDEDEDKDEDEDEDEDEVNFVALL